MEKIRSLLDEIAQREWLGRSLMQEARLSNGVFKYHAVTLEYPWAKHLSFAIDSTTYALHIPRKKLEKDIWILVCSAALTPTVEPEHRERITQILEQVLHGQPDAT